MKNFDLKKFLIENKLTNNSKILAEADYYRHGADVTTAKESVEEAFIEAGILLSHDVYVIESENKYGTADEAYKDSAENIMTLLEKTRIREYDPEDGESVEYIFNAITGNNSFRGLPDNVKLQLIVSFLEYEYFIFQ